MNTNGFDNTSLRSHFPSLAMEVNGQRAIYFDNPGGTQVPQDVIDAVTRYYREQNANAGGVFETSRRTDRVIEGAREAMADLLCAPSPETIIFGPNMTSLAFHLARSIARIIKPGDEVVVTDLDHDANVAPWTCLSEVGATIRVAGINPEDCTLDMASFRSCLSGRTKLVAVTHASNAVGTIPNVAELIELAHQAGALVFVDAVQYAPHGPIDVQKLDCDFLACSAYKFFGPHAGVLYGKRELLEQLNPYKVRPAPDVLPWRWETGTGNHEGMAGVAAAVGYLEGIGRDFGAGFQADYEVQGYSGRRLALKTAMRAIKEYEKELSRHLIEGLRRFDDVTVYGITDLNCLDERLSTVAFTWARLSPRATAEYLAVRGIFCWSGNYYALRLMERLGLQAEGGAVRIGLAHYNTHEEVNRLFDVLTEFAD